MSEEARPYIVRFASGHLESVGSSCEHCGKRTYRIVPSRSVVSQRVVWAYDAKDAVQQLFLSNAAAEPYDGGHVDVARIEAVHPPVTEEERQAVVEQAEFDRRFPREVK